MIDPTISDCLMASLKIQLDWFLFSNFPKNLLNFEVKNNNEAFQNLSKAARLVFSEQTSEILLIFWHISVAKLIYFTIDICLITEMIFNYASEPKTIHLRT